MIRSRRPIPPYIRNLTPSGIKNGMYDITWDGITYTMPLELSKNLAYWFKDFANNSEPSLTQWYEALAPEQKEQITRTGLADTSLF
jgi:hypothetical protein